MPEEIVGRIEVRLDSRALAKRPDLAAHIAVISSGWAEIEDELTFIFIAATDAEPAVAAAVLGKVFNMHVRLKMIETAVEMRFEPSDANEFNRLCREVKKRANDRNRVVHCLWVVHDDHPDALLRLEGITDPRIKFQKYIERDFLEIELRQLELHLSLKRFAQTLPLSLQRDAAATRERFWRLTASNVDPDRGGVQTPQSEPAGRIRSPRPRQEDRDEET